VETFDSNVSLWPEISERDVVIYGVGLREGLRLLAKQYIPGPPPSDVSLAADRVLSPLPLDVQIAVMLAWMTAAILVNEAIHRRGS
jgi:hypothetical protein